MGNIGLDYYSDESSTYAIKVPLDPRHTSTMVGVVLTIEQ